MALNSMCATECSSAARPSGVKGERRGRLAAGKLVLRRQPVPDLEFSSQPDGMFISNESWDSGTVKLQQNDKSLVILGTPDMVLEVISKSSTLKDQKTKKALYHQAGIREYWMADSRLASPTLIIYRHTARAYVPMKANKGCVKSTVLGASFRLIVEQESKERRKVRLERS